jgi:hypothetical protein
MSRKKLSKLFGKLLPYSATIGRLSDDEENVLLLNVCQGGKEVSDHCWISRVHALKAFNIGDEITFHAVATTYKDKKGRRKNGLIKCQSYFLVDHKKAMDIHNHDCQNKKRRLNK